MKIFVTNAPIGSSTMGYTLIVDGVLGSRVAVDEDAEVLPGIYQAEVDQALPFQYVWDDGEDEPNYSAIGEAGSDGGGSITVSPIIAQASGGDPKLDFIRVVSQGSGPLLSFTCVDVTGAPVDLTGKTLRFVVGSFDGTTTTTLFSRSTGSGVTVSGDDNNIANVQVIAANTAIPGKYMSWLWNITNDVVLAKGSFTIVPANKV